MGTKTRVRIPQGMQLRDPLLPQLETLFAGKWNKTVFAEEYQAKPDMQVAYQARVESLHEAFLFLLEAIPAPSSPPFNINEYLKECFKEGRMPPDLPFEAYQGRLVTYLSLLLEGLIGYWNLYSRLAIAWLEKAEQYVILQNGAPDLATLLSTFEENSERYIILLWEKQLPSCPKETLEDLEAIKEGRTDEIIWFQHLPEFERLLLRTCLSKTKDIAQIFSFIPRQLTSLPATNLSENQLLILRENGQNLETLDRFEGNFRADNLASPAMLEADEAIKSLYCRRTVEQMYFQVRPTLMHTSANVLDLDIANYNLALVELTAPELNRLIHNALVDLKAKHPEMEMYWINHLIHFDANHFKKTKADDFQCQLFLKGLENWPKDEGSTALRERYQALLEAEFGLDKGREMELYGYEHQLCTQSRGRVLQVGGEDSVLFALMHVYAQRLDKAFQQVDQQPTRHRYTAWIQRLWESRHFQAIAALSAPGALGLKHADQCWHPDITALLSEYHQQTVLAYNGILRIFCSSIKEPLRPQFASCCAAALRLSADNQKNFLTGLRDLMDQEDLWNAKKTYPDFWTTPEPFVIERVKKILDAKEAEVSAIAQIFYLILVRSEQSCRRMPSTEKLYSSIKRIYETGELVDLYEKTRSMEYS